MCFFLIQKSFGDSASRNDPQKNSDDCNDKQKVNYCSGTVSEKSDEPKKDQDNCDEIK